MTRDNLLWTLGLLAGLAGFVAGHFDRFPYIALEYQGTIELSAITLALICAKLGMSPLKLSGSSDPTFDLKVAVGIPPVHSWVEGLRKLLGG